MQIAPLKQFLCDTCGGLIVMPEQGIVTWAEPDFSQGAERIKGPHGFRIVHVGTLGPMGRSCIKMMYDKVPASAPLVEATGQEAVNFWRARMIDVLLDADQIDADRYNELDVLLMRLTMPHYEAARAYLSQAWQDGYFDQMPLFDQFRQATLRELIKTYAPQPIRNQDVG
jgi:hypothetical protein